MDVLAPQLGDAYSALEADIELIATDPFEKVSNNGQIEAFETGLVIRISSRPNAEMQVIMSGHYDTVFPPNTFTDIEDIGDDIGAAVDTLCTQCPSVKAVTLWGLCDAASAAMFYAGRNADSRIDSLVLLNPWVRTEAGEARAQASGYYGSQLTSAAAWLSLLKNPGRVFRVIANLAGVARRSVAKEDAPEAALPDRVMTSLDAFAGKALLLISGNDLTAREFLGGADADDRCIRAIDTGRVSRCDLADADHTFSTAAWRDWVAQQTIAWLAR